MAKVLLVEDDNNLREIYQARLTAEGYDITTAQNGEEALVSAKQNRPDLIISDVMMPRISGFEMLDILRNTDELKQTKVIMLTALGQAEDQTRASNLGADKYLVKSQVTLEDIVNAAKELLGEAPATSSVAASGALTAALPDEPNAPEEPIPAPAPEPSDPEPAVEPIPAPAPGSDPAVPASVVPQPDTEVVVPPAPAANPEPPQQTVVPVAEPPVEPSDNPTTSVPPAATASVAPSAAAADSAVPQSTAEETQAVKAQINDFAQAPADAPLKVEPSAAASEAASNDATIQQAVEQLNATGDEPPASVVPQPDTEVVVPPAPAANPEPPQQTVVPVAEPETPVAAEPTQSQGGQKVIQPLSDISEKPDINELLAREEARKITGDTAAEENPSTPSASPQPSQPPAGDVDPNSISL